MGVGSTVVFRVAAGSPQGTTYRWSLNGSPLSDGPDVMGSASPAIVISNATSADEGIYTCVATNSFGTTTSAAATLALSATADVGRLTNISCRAEVGTGANILIAGFVVGGQEATGPEPLLFRGSGPALVPFEVPGTLPDPQIQLFSGSSVLGTDDGWAGNTQIADVAASVGAFSWPSASSHDSALLEALGPGPFTVQVAGQGGDSGVALAEVYDATPRRAYTPASPRLINVSARVAVGTGGDILIAGFAIGGTTSRTVLIRASGPALIPFGVGGTLPDPMLSLYSGSTMLVSNSGWGGDPVISATASLVGAFSWGAAASNDSAILVTLPPGPYTAQVSGAGGDTGVALVEVYEVP